MFFFLTEKFSSRSTGHSQACLTRVLCTTSREIILVGKERRARQSFPILILLDRLYATEQADDDDDDEGTHRGSRRRQDTTVDGGWDET